jgi:D-amino peptidase
MNVYLSIDLEGVAGVVHADQTRRGGHDFERARRWMTAEANAAIAGAFEGGATSVLVNDSHGDMRNLLLEELDPRVELISGSLKPLSMVQGVGGQHGVALFVGYHAGAGTRQGILDHTYLGRVISGCRVGQEHFDEAAINAAVCGEAGVPVGLLTGDATVCRTARQRFGDIETVEVKEAITRYAAKSLSPARAQALIRSAACRAVERARAGAFQPFLPKPPHELELDFVNSACADAAELVPGTERLSGLTTRYRAKDAETLLRVVRAWSILANSTMI